jgi:hypothetical protein
MNMLIEKLRDSVRSIPGVASAEVTLGPDEEPLVRVWTDGSRPDADVQGAVESAVSINNPNVEADGRFGLDRNPDNMMPDAPMEWAPGSINAAIEVASPTGRIARLAIEESVDCVEVRAVDDAGRSGSAVVGDGDDGLSEAIAVAVARLRDVTEPTSIRVDVRDVDGSDVVTALIDLPSGDRVVGAAIATGGQPFTLGRAIDAALSDAR